MATDRDLESVPVVCHHPRVSQPSSVFSLLYYFMRALRHGRFGYEFIKMGLLKSFSPLIFSFAEWYLQVFEITKDLPGIAAMWLAYECRVAVFKAEYAEVTLGLSCRKEDCSYPAHHRSLVVVVFITHFIRLWC